MGAGTHRTGKHGKRRAVLVLAGAIGMLVAPAAAHADESAAPPAALAEAGLPAAALRWIPPELATARRKVERLEEELGPWRQLDYSARLRPLLRYRDYPGDGKTGDLLGRFGVSASVALAPAPATRVRALQELERARQTLRLLSLHGLEDALLAHAYLLLAQERDDKARRELLQARSLLREELSRHEGGPAPALTEPLELRTTRLAERKAALEHRSAQADLANAREQARKFGLAAEASYRRLRFVLAGERAGPAATHAHRMAVLELLEAEAELMEAEMAPLDDLRLRAAYRGRGAELDVQGGMVNGRPGATLGLNVPGGPERWEFQLSAELVLDDRWSDLPRLEEEVTAAREEVASFEERFRLELERSAALAAMAEEALDLAEEEVALKEEALAELLETSGSRPQRGLVKAERDLSSARVRLYRAWIAYIRKAADLMELSGAHWQARSD
jgi:hypothetical protein